MLRGMRIRTIDPIDTLRALVARHGSQRAAAKHLALCESTFSAMVRGRRDIPASVIGRLGLEKKLVYTAKRP